MVLLLRCRQGNKSLLPVGVKAVQGGFSVAVRWWFAWRRMGEKSRWGSPILVKRKRKKLLGSRRSRLSGLLGYMAEPELVPRDNLILV